MRGRLLLILLLAGAGLLPAPGDSRAEPDRLRLNLLFTSDANGYIEPCG